MVTPCGTGRAMGPGSDIRNPLFGFRPDHASNATSASGRHRPKPDHRKTTQCGGEWRQNSTLPSARGPFPSCPDSKPYTTPLPIALILGPAQGLTPSTREGSATQTYGLFGFACAVIAALGRTHRAPVARGWSPPPRQEPERCRKPFRSLTPVVGTSPPR